MKTNIQKFNGSREETEALFMEMYDQCVDQIFRFIYFKIGNFEEAQDLASATFLKTWNYLKQKEANPKTLKALIYKVARNTVIDYYRTNSNSRETIVLEENADISDEKQDMLKRLEISSDMVLVEKCLLKLKDEYREAIILRFTEDFSITEIAEILDKSKTNTRVLLFRALRALREIINSCST